MTLARTDIRDTSTYLLMRFGRLSRAELIGARFFTAGMLLMPLSLAAGAWVVSVLARARRSGT